MSKIIIFAGTTEGRCLAEILNSHNIKTDVCVATEYGSQLIKSSEFITVHEGRLDCAAMKELYKETGCETVIDATHPYAEIVTKTIKESIADTGIKYIRLRRPETGNLDGCDDVYKNTEECVRELLKTEGPILLTTGSKELSLFTESALKERIVARVLPGMESLKLCYDAGLEGRQIIAMQGPFSEAMNEAILRQYKIAHLVTKESGVNGGFDEKISAAFKAGVRVHVIERPDKVESDRANNQTLSDVINTLNMTYGFKLQKPILKIALIGIGCGNDALLTNEAREFISGADYAFGAARMLDIVRNDVVKYPLFSKEDIVPKLNEIYSKEESSSVAILFSGDSGFFSGATKLYEAIKDDERFDVTVMPGISSVALLAARTGIDWGTANIISLHGKKEEHWVCSFNDSIQYNSTTFLITSGASDIRAIGRELVSKKDGIKIYVGYNLSYADESVKCLSPEECLAVEKEGLYACVIVNSSPKKRLLVPCLRDDEFVREKIPMTKESVRELSVCKLKLRQGDVIYDIGCGTGSIAIQIAQMSESLKVYAFECNDEAVNLTKVNVQKFGTSNVEVLKGMAPECLDRMPKADCAFIGGTKGKLREILEKLYEINSSMRVVINAVSLESITEIYSVINCLNVTDVEITQANISSARKLGEYNLMQANNPVFIFSFEFR